MKKEIKNGLIQGIVGAVTMLVIGVTYASTVTGGTTLTADLFNEKTVPTGAVMAFNLEDCPTGWTIANGTNGTQDLQNEFIRGAVPGSRPVGTTENATAVYNGGEYGYKPYNGNDVKVGDGDYNVSTPTLTVSYTSPTTRSQKFTKVRPQNVALLFCEKI